MPQQNGSVNGTSSVPHIDNYINGEFVSPKSGEYMDVTTPHTGAVCAHLALSSEADVAAAVQAAEKAFASWKNQTVKTRAACMFKLHHLIQKHSEELAELACLENGKTLQEASASVSKGNETVEFACSLPQLIQGRILQVSSNVYCEETNVPVGVVGCIVPFNFPIMVPMWTVPIALTCGNCVILKTSEKCPMTMQRVAKLIAESGVPPGVFNIINGVKEASQAILRHPNIRAITFVGSSPVAKFVHQTATNLGKKCLALGGAKNHLVALSDCDVDMASSDILSSFAGCAGQRCMAASVLVLVGKMSEHKNLLDQIVQKAKKLKFGKDRGCLGPVIDVASQTKILGYLDNLENGAELLLDGREIGRQHSKETGGTFVGASIILHKNRNDRALSEEIFGPVLSVICVSSCDEAISIENANPFGNAACVYTQSGAMAQWFKENFRAGMIGVNIGIPVPREPFSFGGLYGTNSKYGEHDITGEGCMRFFTNTIKTTTKWGKFETGAKEDISQFR